MLDDDDDDDDAERESGDNDVEGDRKSFLQANPNITGAHIQRTVIH